MYQEARRRLVARNYACLAEDRRVERSFADIRVDELRQLYHWRYGYELPDDDAGSEDLELMLNHIALTGGDTIKKKMVLWAEVWAPWLPSMQATTLAESIAANPRRFSSDALGEHLRLTFIERERLGIRTIGSVDVTKETRLEMTRQKRVKRQRLKRRAAGMKTRAEYLAEQKAKPKPWEDAGVSRATWYRLRRGL